MNIEFLQENNRIIKDKLKDSIRECKYLKGAISFWRLKIEDFEKLPIKLRNEKSFICVDIHQPTCIDHLKRFVCNGKNSNIYLFLYRKAKDKKLPLLHAKIVIFYLDNNEENGEVKIWIGSQNFTGSALDGINFESTCIIKTTRESKLYIDVSSYLESIKNCCEKIGKYVFGDETNGRFDHNNIALYKKLQGSYEYKGKDYGLMIVLCDNAKIFKEKESKKILLISGDDKGDTKNFIDKQNKQEFILSLQDKNDTIYYNCEYTSVGTNIFTKIEISSIDGYILRDTEIKPLFLEKEKFSKEDASDLFKKNKFYILITVKKEFEEKIDPKKETDSYWEKLTSENFKFFCSFHGESIQIPKRKNNSSSENESTNHEEIIKNLKEHYQELREYNKKSERPSSYRSKSIKQISLMSKTRFSSESESNDNNETSTDKPKYQDFFR